jgi:hypothetical protein
MIPTWSCVDILEPSTHSIPYLLSKITGKDSSAHAEAHVHPGVKTLGFPGAGLCKTLAAVIPAGQHGVYLFSQANRHSTFVNNLKIVSSQLIRKEFGHELARWYRQPCSGATVIA